MYLHLICEPVESSALWITDIMDGIVRESMKKSLNLAAVTDGSFTGSLYRTDSEISHLPVLVIGASLPWINETLTRLHELHAEPVLVSVYQHRFHCEYSSVSFNTEEAMRELIGYLAKNGKKRIALFGLHRSTIGDLSKLSGFAAGIRDASLKLRTGDIYSRGLIADCAAKLFEKIDDYDAVVCTSDLIAIYLSLYLEQRGVRIPKDICITGFGNWSFADRFQPSITRMYTDLFELGAQAVRLHQQLMYNPQLRHCRAILECSLRIGESTGLAPCGPKLSASVIPPQGNMSAPPYSDDPDIMETLKSELFVRSTDGTDLAVLNGLVTGATYAQIAESANISESTVKYRLSKMLRLLDFTDRRQLTGFAEKYKLLI